MLQAWWIFCICCLLFIVVSLLTPAPPEAQIRGLTWESPFSFITQGRIENVVDPRILAGALILVLAILYSVFH
jgi:SSS family solute:Na+ symporter